MLSVKLRLAGSSDSGATTPTLSSSIRKVDIQDTMAGISGLRIVTP